MSHPVPLQFQPVDAEAVIAGMGPYGYEAALQYALDRIGAGSKQQN